MADQPLTLATPAKLHRETLVPEVRQAIGMRRGSEGQAHSTERLKVPRIISFLFTAALLGSGARAATDPGTATDLSVTLTHPLGSSVGLQRLIYTAHVANAGPGTSSSVRVLNTLPPGTVFDSAGGMGWDCDAPVGRVVTCTLPSLAPGTSAPLLGIAVIPPAQGGTFMDTAWVMDAGMLDPNTGNNTATDSVLVNPAPPVSFYTVTPCRLVNTRDAVAPLGGPALVANGTRDFALMNSCGVPPDAQGVAVNVTVVGASDGGDLRLYPKGAGAPNSSTINFGIGEVRANNAVVPLIAGWISVQCDMPPGSTGTVDFLLDVSGYFK